MRKETPARKRTQKSARTATGSARKSSGFTDAERAAMKERARELKGYATLGFNDAATLDDGAMWPTAFALKELTAAEEARIAALVKKAVS
jgi:hypothetical protein